MGRVEDAMNVALEQGDKMSMLVKLVYFDLLLMWAEEGYPKELKKAEEIFLNHEDVDKIKSSVYELAGRGLISLSPAEGLGWYYVSFKTIKRKKPKVSDEEPKDNSGDSETVDQTGIVITYLNRIAKTGFKEDSKSHRKYIDKAYKDGYTFAQLKLIVDTKCKQWLGSDMARYLRPSTLFSTAHIDEYLAEGNMRFDQQAQAKQRDTRKGAR